MKLLIRISAISCFVFTTALFNSCSGETTTLHAKSNQSNVKEEKPKQQSPKMLVQQFGGCKAHQ